MRVTETQTGGHRVHTGDAALEGHMTPDTPFSPHVDSARGHGQRHCHVSTVLSTL